jgi:hypothetical protein
VKLNRMRIDELCPHTKKPPVVKIKKTRSILPEAGMWTDEAATSGATLTTTSSTLTWDDVATTGNNYAGTVWYTANTTT